MDTIGTQEVRAKLSHLLEKVEKGEKIVITKRGKAVAMLTPFTSEQDTHIESVIQSIREGRKNIKLRGLSLKQMIDEGRRF